MTKKPHSAASSLREQYIEYGFISVLCQEMWKREMEMDILRSHTDRSGYDILLEANGIQRHIQLKSSFVGAKTSTQKINIKLAEKPSGCVVWVRFEPATLEQTEYLWFGSKPGEALPEHGDKLGRHSKGNAEGIKAERPSTRILNKGQFESVGTALDILLKLFG